ncbi:MAG: hypothetical protein ACPHRO_11975 [Nannocystaceae bacterium]
MGFWKNLWNRRAPPLTPLHAIVEGAEVRVGGAVEALELLTDPTSGRQAVAIDYLAKVPGALDQIYPGLLGDGARSVYRLHKATPFLLRGDDMCVRIDPPSEQGDLDTLHDRLQDQFGLHLHAEVNLIQIAERVEVEGVVESVELRDPRRGVPWRATIRATRLWTP